MREIRIILQDKVKFCLLSVSSAFRKPERKYKTARRGFRQPQFPDQTSKWVFFD